MIFLALVFFTACSWPLRRSGTSETVSREEYNKLLAKYQKLAKKTSPQADSETVTIGFDKELENLNQNINSKSTPEQTWRDQQIESQISQLRKAYSFFRQKKFPQALEVLKPLEVASHKQVQVRAKFLIGDILFFQNEFDLSMQVFEEIITRHAFSGVVVEALGRLIVCSEKLQLKQKEEKYYSILHDFF